MQNEKWNLIKNLDLSTVKAKFLEQEGIFFKWTNGGHKLEAEYRQFLYLAATHPNEVVVPWTQQLDDFWHAHILDTAKYNKDCLAIFGKMFHHNPHMPKGSEEQVKAFNKTKEMYKESFGEKAKVASSNPYDPGCAGMFIPVFCGGHCDSHSSHDGHSHDSGSHDGGHNCDGSSDGGASCGGGCGGGGGD